MLFLLLPTVLNGSEKKKKKKKRKRKKAKAEEWKSSMLGGSRLLPSQFMTVRIVMKISVVWAAGGSRCSLVRSLRPKSSGPQEYDDNTTDEGIHISLPDRCREAKVTKSIIYKGIRTHDLQK